MPDTRVQKQEAVLKHIKSLMPEANDIVVRTSDIVVDPNVDDRILSDSLAECKEVHANLSIALKDLQDFCSDEERYRYENSLLQMQITFASLITSLMSTVVARSSRKSKVASDSDGEDQFLQTLKNLVVSSRRPLSEPSVFSGDPLDYAVWKSEFNSFVDEHSVNAAEKIHSLKKYTSGRARECIEGYLCVFSDASYKEARRMLDLRFGDRFIVTFAFREKLEKWPKIADKDHQALQKFSDFLKHIQSNLKELNTVDVLDDPKENYKMLKLLPQWCVNKWADRIETYQEEHDEAFPPFENFVKFVSAQAKRMNNPIIAQVNSKVSSSQSSQSSSSASSKFKSRASLSTSSTSDSKAPSCRLCGGSHSLQKCDKFAGLSYDDRCSFVRENHLCFGCLRGGHRSNDCRSRNKCDTCGRRHPTLLHNPNWQDSAKKPDKSTSNVTKSEEPVVANAVSSKKGSDQVMSSMVLPVWLTHSKVPNRSRLVYALLDSQSDTSFILDQTLNSFPVESTEVELSVSTMTGLNQNVKSRKCSGFEIRGHNLSEKVQLPTLYSRSEIPNNRDHFPTPSFCRQYSHLDSVSSKLQSFSNIEVGLLIGFNCSKASCPLEVVLGPTSSSPYAVRTPIGWSVVGSNIRSEGNVAVTNRITCTENTSIEMISETKEINPRDVLEVLHQDFKDVDEKPGMSKDDRKFTEITDDRRQLDDGRYEVPMPFKEETLVELECNIDLAEKRLQFLKRKMENNAEYRAHYIDFMKENEDLNFCEKVPQEEINKRPAWYIPHHGIYHKIKKKIRVVYDCSARFNGKSLNDCLLTGPDLINSLVGVLLRFRKETVAFQSDIKKMFPQFSIPPGQRDYVRYLWWKDGDTRKPPVHMRMTRHVFGAVSSMGCANVGIRAIASDFEEKYGFDCGDIVRNSFYVDDCLHSVATSEIAIDLITRLCRMFSEGRVELAKFVSSSPQVIQSIDQSLVAEKVKVDFADTVIERALGVVWNVTSDWFTYDVSIDMSGNVTRRKILSIVSSVFDPLGLVSPFILLGKQILQELCVSGLGWDDKVQPEIEARFMRWIQLTSSLHILRIPRCYKRPSLTTYKVELHTFCDGSTIGYGVCSYLRLIPEQGPCQVKLVFGKSRVTPVKPMTVPRIELCAAVLAVRVSLMLEQELKYEYVKQIYYSDSKVVLGYINNSTKRFHVFVANRVGFIQSNTNAVQWKHIDGKRNPADWASRGGAPRQLVESDWFEGPIFLKEPGETMQKSDIAYTIDEGDEEVKKVTVHATYKEENFYTERLARFSSFTRLIRVVSLVFKWLRMHRTKIRSAVSADDLYRAKLAVVWTVQQESFKDVFKLIATNTLQVNHPLKQFSLFVDCDQIIRVGGRLSRSKEDFKVKFPILIPKTSYFAQVIIRYCHSLVFHQGRGLTINCIRQSGFFIIGASSLVRSIIHSCVVCIRLRGATVNQKMADLPVDRVERSCPFDYCGVDFFGPFFVKCRRSSVKYYGCLFTCLYSRAVHVEVCASLSTDSFIMALRRFIAIRGPVRRIRCDRGTNFVGASNELKQELESMKENETRAFLQKNDANIEFVFNPPSASHFGGVFERQIGTIRRVFEGILQAFGNSLNAESLTTFLYEATAIVNARPLACVNINDETLEPLTPNHLLTGKSRIVVSPPGTFVKDDMYLVKHWKRVQYLANLFWTRWRAEYLSKFHHRSKWTTSTPNFQPGDVVLVVDEALPRNKWKLARLVSVNTSEDGYVRSARVKMISVNENKLSSTELDRPTNKLILLVKEGSIPRQ